MIIGIVLILLYRFLKSKEEPKKEIEKKPETKKEKKEIKTGKFTIKETIQSPTLRSTFNYVNDSQPDGSTGKLTYGGDNNIKRWGIAVTDFTHIKFPNGMIFKLRKPNSTDTYGYFVDKDNNKIKEYTDNFFSDFIQLGTFS